MNTIFRFVVLLVVVMTLLPFSSTDAQTVILFGPQEPCAGSTVEYSAYLANLPQCDDSVGTWRITEIDEFGNEIPCNSLCPAEVVSTGITSITIRWTGAFVATRKIRLCFSIKCMSLIHPEETWTRCMDITVYPSMGNNPLILRPQCGNNGSIALNVVGGKPPYTYLWSNGSTGSSISGLGAGNYSVTVTDSRGCAWVQHYTLVGRLPLNLSVTKEIPCNSADGGELTVTSGCGTAPFTYAWKKNGLPFGTNAATQTGLGPGTYTVTVTDATGATSERTIVLTNPANDAPLDFTFTSQPYTGWGMDEDDCWVTAFANPTGGRAPYTYRWDGGAPDNLNYRNKQRPCSFTVIVTDARGCEVTKSISFGPCPLADNPFGGNPIVAPNPNEGLFDVAIDLTQSADVDVTVVDLSNNVVFHHDFGVLSAGPQTLPVDITSSPAGTYLLLLQLDSNQPLGTQIIKQ